MSFINTFAIRDDIQKVMNQGFVAMSIAIILLSAISILAVIETTVNHEKQERIISEKIQLLKVMRIKARERLIYLYEMINQEDMFKNDESRMKYYSVGADFANARIKIMSLVTDAEKIELLNKQGQVTLANSDNQDRVVDLVFQYRADEALKVLRNKVVPGQNMVFSYLEQLNTLLENKGARLTREIEHHGRIIIFSILIICTIIVAISFYVKRFTLMRSNKLINSLDYTRKELKNTHLELTQQKEAMDNHAIVSVADNQGKIIYVNDKFCDISGYDSDELLGQNHRILKSGKHDPGFYNDIWKSITNGNIWHGRICNRKKDGNYYWVETTIMPFLDANNKPYQYVSIRTEITELLDAKVQAESANHAKNLFLSSISHELRTPMNSILGFAQLLQRKITSSDDQEMINSIINSGTHLNDLINDILDISRIESGNVELNMEDINVREVLESSITLLNPEATHNSLKIENRTHDIEEVNVQADKRRLKQVFVNILSNAIKYNKSEGKIVIDYLQNNKDHLTITITDTGFGIDPTRQNDVFTPFNRAGREGHNISGTGLGLSITKNLLESMGGTIDFYSELDIGTTFTINIPLSTSISNIKHPAN